MPGTQDRTPPVARSIDELLDGVTAREPMKGAESLSTATFERVVIGGDRYVVKYLHCDDDWVMRATGDLTCRPALMWTSGLFAAMPEFIDHTTVGVATGLGRHGWGSALLMTDVGEHLVPDGDDLIDPDVHEALVVAMARFHARYWGFHDTVGLTPAGNRYFIFNRWLAPIEEALGSGAVVPTLVARGYANMAELSPALASLMRDLFADPSPFLTAIADTPATLVHSDWKLGNLGLHPDGRAIVLDWAFPGEGAGATDLAWYLGVNCRRIPTSKEAAIDVYRRGLEDAGVPTRGWWDRQLGAGAARQRPPAGLEQVPRRARRRVHLVGGAGPRRRPVPAVSDVGSAYAAAAGSWAGGPSRVYQHLADALVARAPGVSPVAGRRPRGGHGHRVPGVGRGGGPGGGLRPGGRDVGRGSRATAAGRRGRRHRVARGRRRRRRRGGRLRAEPPPPPRAGPGRDGPGDPTPRRDPDGHVRRAGPAPGQGGRGRGGGPLRVPGARLVRGAEGRGGAAQRRRRCSSPPWPRGPG